jgi:hypothetical protein
MVGRGVGAGPALRSRVRFRNAARRRIGRLAQLVERLLYTERVGGSSPSPPTSHMRHLATGLLTRDVRK